MSKRPSEYSGSWVTSDFESGRASLSDDDDLSLDGETLHNGLTGKDVTKPLTPLSYKMIKALSFSGGASASEDIPTPPTDDLVPCSSVTDKYVNTSNNNGKSYFIPSSPPLSPLPAMQQQQQLQMSSQLQTASVDHGVNGVHKQKSVLLSDDHDASVTAPPRPGPLTIDAQNSAVALIGTETRVQLDQSMSDGVVSKLSPLLALSDGGYSPSSFTLRQGKKLFTVYKIIIKNGDQQWAVYKRYSEFTDLDKMIAKLFPYIHKHLPGLPPKRFFFDSMDPQFIENRARGLNNYIQSIFMSPVLLKSQSVKQFLCGGEISTITSPGQKSLSSPMSVSKESRFNIAASKKDIAPTAVFMSTPSCEDLNSSYHLTGKKQQPSPASSQKSLSKKNGRGVTSNSSESNSSVALDDFYLLKLIGKGNFGKVMLAQHKANNQVYAIKVISKSSVKRRSAKKLAAQQQQNKDGKQKGGKHDIDHIMTERNVLIHNCAHPFLIGLRWSFQTQSKLYFVTDYVNGGELFFHLQKEHRFSELRSRFYAAEITSALEYLHTEIDVVYRDLKPENILLDCEGHIKLTDFGLAKEQFFEKSNGRTFTYCGTPEYLSPEVIRKEGYGFPVDWWCLGSVLYEMLVGLPPFYSKNTQEMYQNILNKKLKFPDFVGLRAKSIICGLLHRSAAFRLGTGENNSSDPSQVKNHPFFEGLDWDRLYKREYTPPFIPKISHTYDLRNIDPTFVNEPLPQSVLEDSVLKGKDFKVEVSEVATSQFPAGQTFKGFTFYGDDDSHLMKAIDSSDDFE
ncbi:hypothetical protein MIR68_005362 [Amoeboaphelidium protococcarum]|nr:hypothetical protein MIR68_005362 [Amoeboaphelidium protococcarum]